MHKNWILNKKDLESSKIREIALSLINSALSAIDTKNSIFSKIRIENNTLSILDKSFDLSLYKRIKIIGFGKCSSDAVLALESVLGSRISRGVVVDTKKEDFSFVESFVGAHPVPSEENILPGQKIFDLVSNSTEEDLIIVVSSGGGSALLCYPESEYLQGKKLYEELLSKGKTISEMNKIRKHLSLFKGGGLAKICYPATVIGLIFSDVPGDHFEDVASGPTYKDLSTKDEVEIILKENDLSGYDLVETPKEDKYFEKVFNFVLVSNELALEAMKNKAEEEGLSAYVVSSEIYDETKDAVKKLILSKEENSYVILGAGEPKIQVTKKGGSGGRNTHMALCALDLIEKDSLFVSFASDGIDNSDSLGALVDQKVKEKALSLGLDSNVFLENFDSYNFFQKTGSLIFTGKTGANVSDLMFYLKIKKDE